jgi:hypothetical protein
MKAIYIPAGPKNLASLFPTVNFSDVSEYFLELHNTVDAVVATTVNYQLSSCPDDSIRVHFLNSLGAIDAMNFQLISIEQESKSDSFEVATKYPLPKPDHAISRFNVKSNDTYVAKSVEYPEDQMAWVEELLYSPLAWMEWKGTQGQPDSYLPIIISDQKTFQRKEEDRFFYEATLQFKLSHEKFIIRN